MARIDGREAVRENLLAVAKNVVQAIYKAPTVTGRLKIQTEIITDEDLVPIIEMLGAMAKINQFIYWDYMTLKENYERGNPPVLVLVGVDASFSELAWDCGACGFQTCKEFNLYTRENKGMGLIGGGPSCNWKVLDAGIVCDWGAAAAWHYNVDNRVQGSTGGAALMLGYLPGTTCILGIPLGPSGELVWYSRETLNRKFAYADFINTMFRTIPVHYLSFAGGGKPVLKVNDDWWTDKHYLSWSIDEAEEEKTYEVLMEMADIIDKYGEQIAKRYSKQD